MNNIQDIKNKAVLLGWILGLLIIITVLWTLTQPLQAHYLLRTVNGAFIDSGDSRRITAYIPHNAQKGGGKAGPIGYWYSMYNSDNRMFVFAFFRDGILVPLGAVVSANGSVSEIVPLSAHAVKIMDRLPQSILQMYASRIESVASEYVEGRSR
jgi:hypothetical protein